MKLKMGWWVRCWCDTYFEDDGWKLFDPADPPQVGQGMVLGLETVWIIYQVFPPGKEVRVRQPFHPGYSSYEVPRDYQLPAAPEWDSLVTSVEQPVRSAR